jgi:hypothetical protein
MIAFSMCCSYENSDLNDELKTSFLAIYFDDKLSHWVQNSDDHCNILSGKLSLGVVNWPVVVPFLSMLVMRYD